MTQTIEQLTARVRELESQLIQANERNTVLDEGFQKYRRKTDLAYKGSEFDTLNKLAASQAYAEQLREALSSVEWEDFHFDHHGNGQQHCPGCGNQKSVGRHTIQCPIGKALALPRDTSALDAYVAEKVKEYADEARRQMQHATKAVWQRDLAVEALKSCGVNDGLNGPTQYFDEELVELAIKESEQP